MKNKRFQYAYRKNASKLHRATGDWLRDNYPGFNWYQEYPVKKINPIWPNYRAKFDWVCLELKIVLECHGTQHTKSVQWHGRIVAEPDSKSKSLQEVQQQDRLKKEAAEAAGYLYTVVHYNEKPEDVLPKQFTKSYPKRTLPLEQKQESEYDIKRKEKAREYRKKQYQKAKEWRKKQLILQTRRNFQDS